ncbi:MAG: response regulator transcription factor [Paracoccaceae bacterium]
MTEARARVLIVDDEPQILRFLRTSLSANDYDVIEAASGAEALRRATAEAPDVILLDLGLPDMDGKEVVRNLREGSQVPIIVVSARAQEREKIEALDLGADDYINKPFGMGELLARLRATLRHRLSRQGEAEVFEVGAVRVDLLKRLVTRNGERLQLTPREYDLLRALIAHAGKVVTQRQLLQAVWGPAHVEDSAYLRVYIGQLRRKLEPDPNALSPIETEPGVGYRMRDEMS